MKLNVAYQVKVGGRISYNDGRPGHEGVEATVLAVDARGMTVQFDDRADKNYILILGPEVDGFYLYCRMRGSDRLSKERRSWNMAQIKGKNTRPERIVRSLLHRMGYRFRLHVRGMPGKPDIVLKKHRTVVFVHGCFWHRHRGCRIAGLPKTRREWWRKKLEGNALRDRKNRRALESEGWRVIVVWGCEIKRGERVAARLSGMLCPSEVKSLGLGARRRKVGAGV